MTERSNDSWESWGAPGKLELLAELQAEAWLRTARPEQLEPAGDWRTWYIRGGRGSGKTRTGAETLGTWALACGEREWAIVAPTYGDARDTCVEGPSGILKRLGPVVETWNRSLGELRLANGARIYIDGADDGALRIQGRNLAGAWCDEVGLWRQWETAWEESIGFAVRIDPARIVATGTPKGRHGLVRLLLDDERTAVTHMRTIDNAANLSEVQLRALMERHEGTRLGRQELEGELLDDVEGALWTWRMIEDCRVPEAPDLKRIVVGVDPAITASEESNETGIIVAGRGSDGHGYVLSDRSLKGSPHAWAQKVIAAYEQWDAGRIVAESNQGGEMVATTIRTVDPNAAVKLVNAHEGKAPRAGPISALYEQGKVHHVGAFPDLESQLTGWTPEDRDSPDRLDALVWAMTELMLGRSHPVPQSPVSVTGPSHWR